MNDLLASAAPSIAGAGRAVTVADVLERAEQYVAESMKEQPDLEMQVRAGRSARPISGWACTRRPNGTWIGLFSSPSLTEGPEMK